MNNGDFVDLLVKSAKVYVENGVSESVVRNNHMNKFRGENIPKEISDAIVVDLVNFMALQRGIDLAMYTTDLD